MFKKPKAHRGTAVVVASSLGGDCCRLLRVVVVVVRTSLSWVRRGAASAKRPCLVVTVCRPGIRVVVGSVAVLAPPGGEFVAATAIVVWMYANVRDWQSNHAVIAVEVVATVGAGLARGLARCNTGATTTTIPSRTTPTAGSNLNHDTTTSNDSKMVAGGGDTLDDSTTMTGGDTAKGRRQDNPQRQPPTTTTMITTMTRHDPDDSTLAYDDSESRTASPAASYS
ncbi:hypothetical protein EDB89DRAFT_1914802 [Lactarius sanguifluus]|nr:hypothetical protein EDB89DRAFT_1914802 [Lactarius sanguifluus]